jgi:N-acetyl-D-muramate 6-phosphate phosphatase
MPLDLSRIRGLCFDVDGTLQDTDDQFVQRLAGLLMPFRFFFPVSDPRPFARWTVMITETPANFLMGIPDFLHIDDEIASLGDFLYRRGLGKKPSPFVLIPGVKEMLAKLHTRFLLSLVTARGARTLDIFINQFDLRSLFTAIVSAQTCPHTKPYPDPVLWAAAQMGIPAGSCLMIGDTKVDILSGKAAGAQTIGVLCGFGTEQELRRAGADLILQSTPEVAQILQISS